MITKDALRLVNLSFLKKNNKKNKKEENNNNIVLLNVGVNDLTETTLHCKYVI